MDWVPECRALISRLVFRAPRTTFSLSKKGKIEEGENERKRKKKVKIYNLSPFFLFFSLFFFFVLQG
jgi:hypothetical protein